MAEPLSTENIDESTAYTICRLIAQVGWKLRDDWDWQWVEKISGNYRSHIDPSLWSDAWKLLLQKDWLSLQSTNGRVPKISSITPLKDLSHLRTLVLQGNEIKDLRPIEGLTKLRYLSFASNQVVDAGPLASMCDLEELHLGDNPIDSLAVLESLPNLRELYVSPDQIPALSQCKRLAPLKFLRVYGNGLVRNLKELPEMPLLKVLRVTPICDLAGVERFTSLGTLDCGGSYPSLGGVETLKDLTHFSGRAEKEISLKPVSRCYRLRSLRFNAPKIVDLSAIGGLPVLHELVVGKSECDRAELEKIVQTLTPWSEEYQSSKPESTPSLNIQVVTQEEFDRYNGKEKFGTIPGEVADGMFESEHNWVVEELTTALSVDFEEPADFNIPYEGGYRRSQSLVLYSLRAYESFREIALTVQKFMCGARNEWIFYTQALLDEGPDLEELPEGVSNFTVWLYRDKIVATEKDAEVVRKLINWS